MRKPTFRVVFHYSNHGGAPYIGDILVDCDSYNPTSGEVFEKVVEHYAKRQCAGIVVEDVVEFKEQLDSQIPAQGSYIWDGREMMRAKWERLVAVIPKTAAFALLGEELVDKNGWDRFIMNKCYVIYGKDDCDRIYAVYNHDGAHCIIRSRYTLFCDAIVDKLTDVDYGLLEKRPWADAEATSMHYGFTRIRMASCPNWPL